jgi:hypothetical protein
MADSLVNHSFISLAQGVSEQAIEARHETQVEEMENCIPSISRGVMRRNPINFVATLKDKDGVELNTGDYFMYSYDRGTAGEQYVILLGHRKWYVYDILGTLKGSYNDAVNINTNLDYLDTNGNHPKEVFSLVTVGDHTWVSNNQITTAMSGLSDGLSQNYHRRVAIYLIKNTDNVITETTSVTVGDTVTATQKIEGFKYHVKLNYNDNTYITSSDKANVSANNTYRTGTEIATRVAELLNDGHYEAVEATVTSDPRYVVPDFLSPLYFATPWYYVIYTGGKYKFFWNNLLIGESSTTSITVGIYTYNLYGAVKATTGLGQYYAITRSRQVIVNGDPLGSVWKTSGPLVYNNSVPESATLEYNDSFGSTASYGFKGVVPSSDKLPESLPQSIGEVLVKVDASEDAEGGEYWLKWNGDTWAEDRAPGLDNVIDHTTMPHEFIRASDGSFTFGFYGEFTGEVDSGTPIKANSSKWADRLKGDEDSAPVPSFIGRKISSIFIHNNRLGVLAEDAVVLSELATYGNFFPTTVRAIPATDPIDVIVATTDVTGLRKAVSLSGSLLIFSDEAQFSLSGGGDSLTPETAIVSAVSSYNYSYKAPAKVVGSKVLFTTESGNGTQVFTMKTESISSGAQSVTADNTSLHIPTYLPTDIRYIVSHSVLGYVFMVSQTDPTSIYVINTVDINGQQAQSAFHKWTFKYQVLGVSVIDNSLVITFNTNGVISVCKMSLDVPANVNEVDYVDEIASGELTNYESFITLSKWFLKDGNGYGNRRGRLQIRTALFSVGRLDKYKVEIFNEALLLPAPTDEDWVLTDAVWDDTAYWSYSDTDTDDSTVVWKDAVPFFSRIYYNDEKVTVASNSETTFIRFSSNDLDPRKGFTLSTINLEGLFRQRSQRL